MTDAILLILCALVAVWIVRMNLAYRRQLRDMSLSERKEFLADLDHELSVW